VVSTLLFNLVAVAERLRQAYPTLLEWAGVGSIPANSDALNVPSFRRWRFDMKLSPFFLFNLDFNLKFLQFSFGRMLPRPMHHHNKSTINMQFTICSDGF
jgi:hypothetical protein